MSGSAARPDCPVCAAPHDPPPPLPATPRVSVVVTHYEQHDDLARTLAALAAQTRPPDEVVVSDDGSARPPEVGPGVRLVTQADRGFRAALARNRGAAATTGDLLVFLDADTAPEPGYLAALCAPLLDETDLLVVGRRRHTALDDPDEVLPDPAWLAEGWAASDDLRDADDGSFRHVISAVMACSAWWWRRVGGFDPGFDAYGGEDWELAHRWWRAGGRLRHVPGAVAWHRGPDAGAEPRTWTAGATGSGPDRALVEALAVGRRVHAAPVALRGLLGAPPRVVLTHDEDLTDRELVVAADGLLAGVPQAAVLTDRAVLLDLGDPRVRPTSSALLGTASLRVHLHAGLVGEPDAWRDLVAAGPGVHRGVVVDDLRVVRRAHLGLEPTRDPAPTGGDLPAGLRPLGTTTPAAWLGGWY